MGFLQKNFLRKFAVSRGDSEKRISKQRRIPELLNVKRDCGDGAFGKNKLLKLL